MRKVSTQRRTRAKCTRDLRENSMNACQGLYGGIEKTESINPPPSCVQLWAAAPKRFGQDAPFSRSLVAKKKRKKKCAFTCFPQKARFPWVIRNERDVRCESLWRKNCDLYLHTCTLLERKFILGCERPGPPIRGILTRLAHRRVQLFSVRHVTTYCMRIIL